MKRRRWLRLRFRDRERAEADVDAELSLHIAERMEQLMARGLTAAEARAEAERRLGGVVHARARLVREAWERDRRLSLLDRAREWGDDVRYAARTVTRERGYAAVIIVTLALGIGANATMFGLVDRLLLSGPAHVEAADELYRFYINIRYDRMEGVQTFAPLNYPALRAFREGVPSVREVSAYMSERRVVGSGIDARQIELGAVTASFFRLTGVRPVVGRVFGDSEDAVPQGAAVVVLGYELWQTQFGGRPDVVGEDLELSGVPHTIIGVAPRGFTGVELKPVAAWVPLSSTMPRRLGEAWHLNAGSFMMPIVGRLARGATVERAAAEATSAWRAAYEGEMQAQREAYVTLARVGAGSSGEQPLEARVSRWLVAVSAIVLLVACANVANLFFVRGLRRRQEVAVRLALGISRRRLLRLLFLEALLLVVLGGVAALAVAYWGADLVRGVLLPDVEWTTSPLSARVLGVAAGLTLFVALVTGLAPALQATRTELTQALRGSAQAPPAQVRTRSVLAVLQAAFCVILLVGAGLFVRSLWSVRGVDLGLEAERVLQLRFEWQARPDQSPEERAAHRSNFFGDALERLARVPGVEVASAAIGSPFHSMFGGYLRAAGVDSIPSLPGGGPYLTAVTAGYFATLGTPLLRGRPFLPHESGDTEPVAILSRTTAELLWPGGDPLNRCIYLGADAPCTRVVGVAADVSRFGVREEAATQFYVPLGQQPAWMGGPAVLVRTAGRPERMTEPVRRALHELEPSLRHVRAAAYREFLDPQWRPWKLGATLFVLCGLLALVIAAIGLYSVIAYLVQQRTHEIGVRMALGAERRDIVRMVVRQTMLLAGYGIALGLGVALVAAPYLEPLLFETAGRDVQVLSVVAVTLAHAALAAGIGPALRASRVQPTEALRAE
jgi:predicted permease